MRYSLDEKTDEKYDGRYGRASRKYQKLRAKKQKELGRAIEYDQLPDLTTDAEFESEVGMSKQEFAELMRERDRFASEISHYYQSSEQKAKQALVDRFNPIKIVERFMNGGDLMGAEKSAYKALFAAGNMEQVMYNALYVGLPQYDRQKGQFVMRPGSKPLMHYLEKVKGKNYQNFQNYGQAVAMLEHYKRAHNLETISDAYKYADSKEFYEMAGFSKEQAKKWMEEATVDSKEAVRGLQEFFKANREFPKPLYGFGVHASVLSLLAVIRRIVDPVLAQRIRNVVRSLRFFEYLRDMPSYFANQLTPCNSVLLLGHTAAKAKGQFAQKKPPCLAAWRFEIKNLCLTCGGGRLQNREPTRRRLQRMSKVRELPLLCQ